MKPVSQVAIASALAASVAGAAAEAVPEFKVRFLEARVVRAVLVQCCVSSVQWLMTRRALFCPVL